MEWNNTLWSKSSIHVDEAVAGNFLSGGMDMAPNTTYGSPHPNYLIAKLLTNGIRTVVMGWT